LQVGGGGKFLTGGLMTIFGITEKTGGMQFAYFDV
jgi:hypothetical protein